jgi:hypothetical protein
MGPSNWLVQFIDGRDSERAASGYNPAIGSELLDTIGFVLKAKRCVLFEYSIAIHHVYGYAKELFNIDRSIICTVQSLRKSRIEFESLVSAPEGASQGRH